MKLEDIKVGMKVFPNKDLEEYEGLLESKARHCVVTAVHLKHTLPTVEIEAKGGGVWYTTAEELDPYFEIGDKVVLAKNAPFRNRLIGAGANAVRTISGVDESGRYRLNGLWLVLPEEILPYVDSIGLKPSIER